MAYSNDAEVMLRITLDIYPWCSMVPTMLQNILIKQKKMSKWQGYANIHTSVLPARLTVSSTAPPSYNTSTTHTTHALTAGAATTPTSIINSGHLSTDTTTPIPTTSRSAVTTTTTTNTDLNGADNSTKNDTNSNSGNTNTNTSNTTVVEEDKKKKD